jgi:hypothetical protein
MLKYYNYLTVVFAVTLIVDAVTLFRDKNALEHFLLMLGVGVYICLPVQAVFNDSKSVVVVNMTYQSAAMMIIAFVNAAFNKYNLPSFKFNLKERYDLAILSIKTKLEAQSKRRQQAKQEAQNRKNDKVKDQQPNNGFLSKFRRKGQSDEKRQDMNLADSAIAQAK